MGMYTELNIGVSLKGLSEKEIEILNFMSKNQEKIEEPKDLPNHNLFGDTRWRMMLWGTSYYFSGQPFSEFIYDEIASCYFLTCRFNIKNYKDEIELFLDFLTPYIQDNGFLGYMRYEENQDPTLIYKEDGQIIMKTIS